MLMKLISEFFQYWDTCIFIEGLFKIETSNLIFILKFKFDWKIPNYFAVGFFQHYIRIVQYSKLKSRRYDTDANNILKISFNLPYTYGDAFNFH